MKTRFLRDIEVSEVGMGCMAFSHGYGKIPDESYSIEAIRNAYQHGCTFFDTAEVYSPNLSGIGHNERIVGKALEPFRNDVVIATKLFVDSSAVRRSGSVYHAVRDHLEASMDRLRTDRIDLYYLHRQSNIAIEHIAEAMGRLINDEMIRGWGLSQVDVDVIDRAQQVTPLSAIQNIYSMVERDVEKAVAPYCLKNNIGIVPFSPIASGLLSGKITPQTQFERKRRKHSLSATTTSATGYRSCHAETSRATGRSSRCSRILPTKRTPRPRRSRSRGCCTNTRTLFRSPAPRTRSALLKT